MRGPCASSHEGFADPKLAFSAYVAAANQGDWCKVINTFAKTARSDAALGAFKTLAVLASAQTDNRPAYLQEFQKLSREHELEYQEESKFVALSVDLMNRRADSPTLADATRVIAKDPESFYMKTMEALMRADPKIRTTYEEVPTDFTVNGDSAAGSAKQRNGGQVVALHFIKTEPGWFLKFQ